MRKPQRTKITFDVDERAKSSQVVDSLFVGDTENIGDPFTSRFGVASGAWVGVGERLQRFVYRPGIARPRRL